jgi:NAD(P)-dependent dehydrogenase (short-subunit alcohol dehydrogenase family)
MVAPNSPFPTSDVTLSARVGSVGDNCLGGWYAYRVFKATLNQIVRTASIELARRAPEAICVALHLGIVDTALFTPLVNFTNIVQYVPTLLCENQ